MPFPFFLFVFCFLNRVSRYRLQERLRLVKAIKLLVLHHQEMSSIDDYSLQTNK